MSIKERLRGINRNHGRDKPLNLAFKIGAFLFEKLLAG